ncbi:MAG: DUF3180 domain-containing protein [Marmoricola sp.]
MSADRDPEEPRGTVHPTGPAGPSVFAGLGLVAGWVVRPLSLRAGAAEPHVGWTTVGVVWFLASIVAGAAWTTWRMGRARVRLEPHRAVNRLVLGKACALVGAALAGGYAGFALAHLNVPDAGQASTQLLHAAIAALGGVAMLVAALLLELACRVPPDR